MQYAGRLSPAEFWARYAEMEERIRATASALPCYAPVGWVGLRMFGDWQWENGQPVTIGLAHGARDGDGPTLHVHTTVRDPAVDAASLRTAEAGPARDKADMLRRVNELGTAAAEPATIPVDGAPVTFTVWRKADRWWAVGHYGGFGLVLEGERISVDHVDLVRVLDLDPYFAGRRAHLRARRGES